MAEACLVRDLWISFLLNLASPSSLEPHKEVSEKQMSCSGSRVENAGVSHIMWLISLTPSVRESHNLCDYLAHCSVSLLSEKSTLKAAQGLPVSLGCELALSCVNKECFWLLISLSLLFPLRLLFVHEELRSRRQMLHGEKQLYFKKIEERCSIYGIIYHNWGDICMCGCKAW